MGADDSSNSRRQTAILLALTLIAGAARFYRLRQSLWHDELYSLLHFFRADWYSLFTAVPNPNHHPLYSLLAKLAILAFGESEWSVRLPAFIMGALTAPVLYWVGRRWWNERTGLAAALIFSLSIWPVWYGQDARGYSGMILFAWIAQALLLSILQSPRPGNILAYLGACAAAGYLHLYALFVPAAHLVLAGLALEFRRLGYSRRAAGTAAAAAAGAMGLVLLLYAPMARDLLAFARTQGQVIAGRSVSPRFFADLLLEWSAVAEHQWLLAPWLALFLVGLLSGIPREWLKLAWLLLPLLLGIFFALITRTFVYPRFFVYAMPAYFLIVAAGLDRVTGWIPRRSAAAYALALGLLLSTLLPALFNYYRLGKQPNREAAQWIRQQNPLARVLVLGLAGEVWGYYDPLAQPLPAGTRLSPEMIAQAYVVASHPWSVGRENFALLDQRCGPARVFPAAGYAENTIWIYHCE